MATQALIPRIKRLAHRIIPPGADRLSREKGQAVLRVIIIISVTLYLAVVYDPFSAWPPADCVWMCAGFLVYSNVILWLTLTASDYSEIRRTAGNVLDMAATTYAMLMTGETGVPFFAVYLWVTIGNGFRFGNSALLISATWAFSGLPRSSRCPISGVNIRRSLEGYFSPSSSSPSTPRISSIC